MSKNIGVFGCGWLGTPLAKNLITKGNSVKGTTTSEHKLEALKSLGILSYHVTLKQDKVEGNIQDFLKDLEVLIINIPPSLRKTGGESFVKRIRLLLKYIEVSEVEKILFISSTSVYGDIEGEINEKSISQPLTASGKQLLEVEKLLLSNPKIETTILRFGGLIGPHRHPVYYLAGRTDLKNGEEFINLIHLDDCILMIETIIKEGYWGLIFNGVYHHHPTKKEYYTTEAIKKGLNPPQFVTSKNKILKKTIKSRLFYVKNHQLLTTIVS